MTKEVKKLKLYRTISRTVAVLWTLTFFILFFMTMRREENPLSWDDSIGVIILVGMIFWAQAGFKKTLTKKIEKNS